MTELLTENLFITTEISNQTIVSRQIDNVDEVSEQDMVRAIMQTGNVKLIKIVQSGKASIEDAYQFVQG